MTDPSVIALRRAQAFQRILEALDLDIAIPSTNQPPFEQQLFEATLLEALIARVAKLEEAAARSVVNKPVAKPRLKSEADGGADPSSAPSSGESAARSKSAARG